VVNVRVAPLAHTLKNGDASLDRRAHFVQRFSDRWHAAFVAEADTQPLRLGGSDDGDASTPLDGHVYR
jgi:hypothetical protein